MASCGISRETGLPLTGLDHVAQSVELIFATRLGEIIMLRWFGSGLPELLGRRIEPRLLAVYRMILTLAIQTWEPRLQVAAIRAVGNTTNALILGHLAFDVLVYYRPNGHRGDLAIEGGPQVFSLAANDNRLFFSLKAAA